ncbi:hypothetical protein TG4357_01003 [Thalassovita gelatinovora]|uniref:Uncharacterized protein n=1 Tax=Thalassovita gelatinovora TaxID=53501 RepID=A0A0P1FX73_THAGE|nr:hypothetical protein [Thalassovita gelatinovora]QIZ80177.1 hypothetical protein HFZ77_06675 [Thalassovita gelatinovora]CUH63989.1 hypothetical protein TG4357_01003 [Thalassovita gelatinovora]SEQ81172.1 hypothetical protein SAMN04488043_10945 [Thalassovita gelatinovora]
MTALTKYQRIEASGLWRASPEEQRREVIVSIGDATLIISDLRDRALTHWSLPAVMRANPGDWPAIYHPDGDPGETLELTEGETEMVAAIEKLRNAIERRRPRPGRLRTAMMAASLASVLAVGVFWLPGAMVDHTLSVVPAAKRLDIGQRLLADIQRLSGPSCNSASARLALDHLAERLTDDDLHLTVVKTGVPDSVMLPGNIMVLNSALFEDYEVPDIAAGHIIAATLRARASDPLDRLLRHSGMFSSLRLLTTGTLPDETLKAYAEALLTQPETELPVETLLQGFQEAGVKSSPYAYALDVSGEATLPLIEADPFPGAAPSPVLSDGDWIRLQSICET